MWSLNTFSECQQTLSEADIASNSVLWNRLLQGVFFTVKQQFLHIKPECLCRLDSNESNR